MTDDHSPDDTVEVSRKWLEENKARFARTCLVTSDVNTGVLGNIKRGRAEVNGAWYKGIAGDDQLIPTAIEEVIRAAQDNPDALIFISDVEVFSDEGAVPEKRIREYENYFKQANQPYKKQWLHCLQENIFVGPASFSRYELLNVIKDVSGEWGNGDEWPNFYQILKSGHQIYTIDKKLVRYRFSTSSVSHQLDKKGLRNMNLELSTCRFFFAHPFRDLLREHHYLIAWDRYLYWGTRQLYYKKNGAKWAEILKRYSKFLSPYAYWRKLTSKV